jgi:Raf kinase inhibitor-like YbhB/YbcL family protein
MRSSRRRSQFSAALVVAALSLSACGTDGRELRDPPPGATAPARQAPAAGTRADSVTTLGTVFAVTTDAWTPGGELPVRQTCDGDDVSPPLVLSLIPPGTVELAIVVSDQDADGALHWVVAGIDPSIISIEEGEAPAGAVEATNVSGTTGWTGPCPPESDGPHVYDFQLFALSRPSGVVGGQDGDRAVDTIRSAALEQSILTGSYER